MNALASPTFLVGAERSGTTLLRLMLSRHPRVAWLNEFEYAVDLVGDGDFPPIDTYRSWLSQHRIFQASELSIDEQLGYPELVRGFLDQVRRRTGKPIVGATVHRHFDRLLRLWPHARFIHLIRDPRDVARSCIGMGWAGNVFTGVQRWIEAEQLWDRVSASVDGSRRIEASYERLVSDPETELTRLCGFLGVRFEPGMTHLEESSTYNRPDGRLASQWRKSLSEREVRLVEARTRRLIESRGYEASGLPPLRVAGPVRVLLYLQDRLARWRFRIRRFGVRLWLADFVGRRLRLTALSRRTVDQINSITLANLK